MTADHRRILLIDDTPSIHDDFRKILRPRPATHQLDAIVAQLACAPVPPTAPGFELDSASQGEQGAALVEAALAAGRPYALAFVDMRMPPGWDGVQTIERLWQIDPDLQVVICTAYSDHPWEQVLARLDVRDRLLVVKKPFDVIEVSQLARTLTAKWQASRQVALRIDSLAQALEQLQLGEAALRRAHGELQVFAHSLAHDLRAPLTALGSFAQLLGGELEGQVEGKALHYLNRIRANAGISGEMIDNLLLLDRIGQAPLRRTLIELGALARELLDEFRRADPQREVALDTAGPLEVEADRELLRLALRHLLDNALKFSAGRPSTRIEIGRQAGADGEAECFFVRDDGPGFDPGSEPRPFRTFRRMHGDREIPGTGAGLVIVNRIMERHGGRLWAQPPPGVGAAFYFTLPPGGNGTDAAGARVAPTSTWAA